MAMTKREQLAKRQVIRILGEEGYATYAQLLDYFDLNLTADPGVVGYMEPSKARIVLNEGLDIEQVSMVVRHEILHEYLSHEKRLLRKLAADAGLDYDILDDIKIKDLKGDLYKDKNFNIAADYEISNRGYTEKDKDAARRINLNGQELRGLVTEDDHPDWVNLSVEEMYDKLIAEGKKQKNDIQKDLENQSPQIGDHGDEAIQQAEEMERQAQNIQDQMDQQEEQQGQDGGGSSGSDDSDQDDTEGEEEGGSSGGGSDSDDDSENGDPGDDEGSTTDGGDSGTSSDKGGPGESGPTTPGQVKQAAQDIEDAADELADDIRQKMAQDEQNGEVFQSEEEQKQDAELYDRLKKIQRAFHDVQTKADILSETDAAVARDDRAKALKNANQYKSTPIARFTMSLNRFIKNEVSSSRVRTWKKFNKTYVNSDIIRKGTGRNRDKNIPSINVYFDRSGSWDEAKTQVGKDAIGTLNKYVQRKEIQIFVYYFGNRVSTEDSYAAHGSGTRGEPILQHIKSTKPDNVIIMTDSDISDCSSNVTVPGAVWFLWKGGISQNLMEHLHGASQTESYDLG